MLVSHKKNAKICLIHFVNCNTNIPFKRYVATGSVGNGQPASELFTNVVPTNSAAVTASMTSTLVRYMSLAWPSANLKTLISIMLLS